MQPPREKPRVYKTTVDDTFREWSRYQFLVWTVMGAFVEFPNSHKFISTENLYYGFLNFYS